jgi:hypothetical protein
MKEWYESLELMDKIAFVIMVMLLLAIIFGEK